MKNHTRIVKDIGVLRYRKMFGDPKEFIIQVSFSGQIIFSDFSRNDIKPYCIAPWGELMFRRKHHYSHTLKFNPRNFDYMLRYFNNNYNFDVI